MGKATLETPPAVNVKRNTGTPAYLVNIPNEETLSAIAESKEHLRQLVAGEVQPKYKNVTDFFISLFSEDEA